MKRKIIAIIMLIGTIFSMIILSGCAKVINTEYKEVDVKITDTYHRAAYTTPIRAGKVTSIVAHPAIYRIYVAYEGIEYTLNGNGIYGKYKNKIGQTVKGKLKIDTYNDNTVKYDIIKIWEK